MKHTLDYSPHYLEAKSKLGDIYALLNKKEFVAAATLIDEAIVELRMMRAAVKTHMDSHEGR